MKIESKKTVEFVIHMNQEEARQLRLFLRSISGGFGAPHMIVEEYLDPNFNYRGLFSDISGGLEGADE